MSNTLIESGLELGTTKKLGSIHNGSVITVALVLSGGENIKCNRSRVISGLSVQFAIVSIVSIKKPVYNDEITKFT